MISSRAFAQFVPGKYWVGFVDKDATGYSLKSPDKYLSVRALERREAQDILIDSTDLPVCQSYIMQVKNTGAGVLYPLKWANGIVVDFQDSIAFQQVSSLDMVRETRFLYPAKRKKSIVRKWEDSLSFLEGQADRLLPYGPSLPHHALVNGIALHQMGYQGQGKRIAVLDGGFLKVNELPAFDSLFFHDRIIATRSFVRPDTAFYTNHSHGMNVLSLMGGNVPGFLMGTAPEAEYVLLHSEDARSEYLIEEYNWVAAAEFADSIGADIINSSLGYYVFDDSTMDHTYRDMDGHTTFVTRGAERAFSKGILVFSSAGNEADDPWRHIIAPSDGNSVIGVGAVDATGEYAPFSSVGPASDGDVKPNLAAMGRDNVVQHTDGSFRKGSGTSFSSPVMAGVAACLWQAFPAKTNVEIREALLQSCHQYLAPDTLLGYGIPDLYEAYQYLLEKDTSGMDKKKSIEVFPNPFESYLLVNYDEEKEWFARVKIYDMLGSLVVDRAVYPWERQGGFIQVEGLDKLVAGMYVVVLDSPMCNQTYRVNKY